jgi:hypothetical protein
MNKKNTAPRSVGRPSLTLKFPAGAFTVKELHALNPQAKWPLTIRQHIDKQLKVGFLSKMDRKEETGKVGKPADLFIRTAVLRAVEARKAAKAEVAPVAEVSLEAPAVEVPAPVAVEAEVAVG